MTGSSSAPGDGPQDATVADFHLAIRNRISDNGRISWRSLGSRTGISDSTIRGWLDPDRGAIGRDNLEKRLRAAGVPQQECTEWLARRESLAPQLGSVEQTPVRPRFSVPAGFWAGLGAGLVLGGLGVWLALSAFGDPGETAGGGAAAGSAPPSEEQCGGLEFDLRPISVTAHVGDTSGRGARLFGEPRRDACRAGAVSEGRELRLVCLELNGGAVDEEVDGTPVRTTAWAKMTSGAWILALYTDLPFTDGDHLVGDLPAC